MNKEFEVHQLNKKGMESNLRIAELFNNLLNDLVHEVEQAPSREMSIVRTKLEEACFFAKKANANNIENQVYQTPSS